MKNKDKNIYIVPMQAKELLEVKGGNKIIPRGALEPMSVNRWEELEIRLGPPGGTKNHTNDNNKTSVFRAK